MTQLLNPTEIRNLPKVDLHRHLDCSMRWSTMIEVAKELEFHLPESIEQKKEDLLVLEPMKDLEKVLKKLLNAQKILANEKILERLAFEACEDAFNDGIDTLELRYAPTFIADGHPELTFEKIHLAFLRGLERVRKTFPLRVGLIGIIQRTKSLTVAESVTDFIIDHKETFIGIDLADNEEGFDPKKFASCFSRAKKSGLPITIHSGEVVSPDSAKWVLDSINILGADRIGHGIQIANDPKIMKEIALRKIPLEVCPYSNYLTQAVRTHQDHPINLLRKEGVLVTVNSDDPGIFSSTLSDDFTILQNFHGWTREEFTQVRHIALESTFLK